MLASLGDYEFQVSSEKVDTFKEVHFTESVSYAEHKVHNRPAILEFTGLNATSATLSLTLDEDLGVNPTERLAIFREAMNNHNALAFTMGGAVLGRGLWVIESIDVNPTRIGAQGKPARIDLNIKLKEYLE